MPTASTLKNDDGEPAALVIELWEPGRELDEAGRVNGREFIKKSGDLKSRI